MSILQWVPGFRRWGRLIRPDSPYNPLSAYITFAPGPVYHLSRLRLIILDSEAQLPRVHARDRYIPRNPQRLGPTSPHDPHVSNAIAELVRPLLPWLQLVAHSLFRRTPSARLRLGGPRHAGLTRPVPRWTFPVSEHPMSHLSRRDWGIFVAG